MSSIKMSAKSNSVTKRDANIELLRALTMIGVIILHINNPLMGGALVYSQQYLGLYWILLGYESLFVCAVNLFLVITGYFMVSRKTVNMKKPIQLIVQVVAFAVAYNILGAIKEHTFSIRSFGVCFLPRNYFVIIYCAVYLLSPFINKLLYSIEIRKLKYLLYLSMILFSIIPTLLDVLSEFCGFNAEGMYPNGLFGSGYGYTFINFLLLYTVGAYIKRIGDAQINTRVLVVLLGINIVVLSIWSHYSVNKGEFVESSSLSYCNPLIILNAMIVFMLFLRIKISNLKTGIIINYLAMPCFTVYLVHNYFFHWLDFDEMIQTTGYAFALIVLALALAVYLLSIMIGYIYIYTFEKIVKILLNRISVLERLKISAD